MDRQDQIINFLSSASAYADIEGADGLDVQRRETHISVVFLVGQSAFKMKRAVAYPYLDFSTLDRRRELCEREITINSRTAPDIYRGVIAVTCNAKGEFALDGDGDPVEWLVSMHRFDDATLWDRQALAGDLDRHDFEVLADQVARFHAKAETCDGDAAVSALAATIDGNRQSMASHTGDLFDFEMVEALFSRTRKAYELAKPVLQTRANEGCVRI
ncbi:MAG: hypothetical protein HQ501_07575, partial [Rhodospirillales bacterium]|nr:hypothetical protein [Rhodospirillales bacterium]